MGTLMRCGLEVVLWCQQFSPHLNIPFVVITHAGDAASYAALAAVLYWVVDQRLAGKVALVLALSAAINLVAKALAAQPRPFEVDVRVLRLAEASGGGLPSGHAQNAVAVWGYVAHYARRRVVSALAAAMVLLVSLSRIYLGVHFPHDVVAGLALGAAVVKIVTFGEHRRRGRLLRVHRGWLIALAFLAAALGAVAWHAIPGSVQQYGPTAIVLTAAWVAQRRWLPFSPPMDAHGRWRAALVGAGSVTVTGLALAGLSAHLAEAYRSAPRVGQPLLALWVGLGVPWLLVHLHLVGPLSVRGDSPAGSSRAQIEHGSGPGPHRSRR